MKRKAGENKKGFTLIELMIVTLIIGILVGIAIPSYLILSEKAREEVCTANCIALTREYLAKLASNSELEESDQNFQTHLQANYEKPFVCPSDGSKYTWNQKTHSLSCPYHGKRIYNILITKDNLPGTIEEIYASFDEYLKEWMEKESKLPIVSPSYASLTWNAANYTGTDKTNRFQAKFWKDYYDYVNVDGFNSSNSSISDFKVFFKRDAKGVATSEPAGVYMQIGSSTIIRFSDGTVIKSKHYSNYIDSVTKELKLPK